MTAEEFLARTRMALGYSMGALSRGRPPDPGQIEQDAEMVREWRALFTPLWACIYLAAKHWVEVEPYLDREAEPDPRQTCIGCGQKFDPAELCMLGGGGPACLPCADRITHAPSATCSCSANSTRCGKP